MKTEFIVTAKTVNDAYNKAREIYSSMGEVSLEEVVNPGKKGFLGLFGAVPAEIKISVDDGKEERKPKKKQSADNSQQSASNKQQNNNKQEKKKHSDDVPQKSNQQAEKKPQEKKKQPVGDGAHDVPQKSNQQSAEKKAEVKAEAPKMIKDEDIEVTVQEKTLAMEFLKKFVSDAGLDCEVKGDMTPNEKGFVPRLITIEGKDAPTLIGHRGEMLDAIQYLSNLCLARKSEGEHKEYVKVVIDIENYREKREMALRALARRMAEKALKYQRNVLLEPMNPYERMIIHSEVQGIAGVSTHSVGYDENRKIVISVDGLKRKKK